MFLDVLVSSTAMMTMFMMNDESSDGESERDGEVFAA